MHVGLNLVYLVPGYTGGTETYAQELIPELVAAAPDVALHRVRQSGGRRRRAGRPWGELIPAVTVPVRARNRVEWVRGEQLLLPALAASAPASTSSTASGTRRPRGDIFAASSRSTTSPIVSRPRRTSACSGLGMRVLVPLAAHRSDRIIVDAASTRDDVDRFLKVSPAKVDVVPLGLGSAPRRVIACPSRSCERELGLGRPADRALRGGQAAPQEPDASARARAGADPAGAPARCSCSPATAPHTRTSCARRAGELDVAGDVRFLGWVDPAELEGLYAAAACFVFPSLMEGFGLPVLEAMARGMPVACSGRGALGEVAGDAALLFDPQSEPRSPRRSSGCSPTAPRPNACARPDASGPRSSPGRRPPPGTLGGYRARPIGTVHRLAILGAMPRRNLTAINPRGYDVNLRSGPADARVPGDRAAHPGATRPSRILDWGCGYGQVTDLLWRAGLDVTAFDYRPERSGGAVRRSTRYSHLRAHISHDPRRLPFDDGRSTRF